jgi:hypothetical protein
MESTYWANRFNGARRVDTNTAALNTAALAAQH